MVILFLALNDNKLIFDILVKEGDMVKVDCDGTCDGSCNCD